jgi:hypothetical protein
MYCTQCGERIEADSVFCRHCGARQTTAAKTPVAGAPPAEGERSSNRSLWIIGIGAAVLLLFVIIGVSSKPPERADTNIAETANDDVAMLDAPSPTPKAKAETWSYRTDEDKVRGATTYIATTTSTNTVRQASPYDSATTMDMMLRKSPAHGTDVLLIISSGQMMCPSYQGCSGTVRFDDAAPERVSFNGPSDNSSETVFVVGAKSFIAKLKKAKRVVVEKTLYQAGDAQFEFDVSGLKWEH